MARATAACVILACELEVLQLGSCRVSAVYCAVARLSTATAHPCAHLETAAAAQTPWVGERAHVHSHKPWATAALGRPFPCFVEAGKATSSDATGEEAGGSTAVVDAARAHAEDRCARGESDE